ncbi:PSD1 and planctomycete cytochrome C domain-containing protein [Calycomorphotria hydatis]|uniref:Planctomycete cytochrome C n=1 Tax=Calycomorphotria hydatis TaxID=2528027 RepID=A0A517T9X6_9PLAN|nr:PSD1 and planctomycete cytochrome C domain-containing protein [Calycomorphotria hydatis]QDT65176.1 Planctomycete cytochrome C [Calycomorphotria hydatis]
MMNHTCITGIVTSIVLIFSANITNADEVSVDYAKIIEPILRTHCYECHGPESREGGVRLSNRRDAFLPGDSEEVVIRPSHAKDSLLIQRVLSTDEFEQMPPEGERLTADEITALTQWINAGAKWPEQEIHKHWAYVAPTRPSVPNITNISGGNAVDAFTAARLDQDGLSLSPQESPARLMRRVYLDLIGLPPEVSKVDQFLTQDSPDAYEAVVDELLSRPEFGEKWARHWLDLARYADSNGFQADQLRESWAYRDWVINAFNRDLPFDQFTIEQIAGDLLPNATLEQQVATGFHRTVTCNVEAGVHPEENRVNQVFDRVNTTGTVWLGTTLECAQCHNHKYDPFTQQEYYQLFSFFNNTPLEVKQSSGVTYDFVGPKIDLPSDSETLEKYEILVRRQEKLDTELKAEQKINKSAQTEWENRLRASLKESPEWIPLQIVDVQTTGGETTTVLEDQSVLVGGSLPGTSTYTIDALPTEFPITAIKMETLTHESLPGGGPGRGDAIRNNFVLNEVALNVVADETETSVPFDYSTADFSQENWDVSGLSDGDLKTGWAIAPQFSKPHWAIIRLDNELVTSSPSVLRFTFDQLYGRGRTIGRLRLSAYSGDTESLTVPEQISKLLLQEKLTRKEQREIDKYYADSNETLMRLTREFDQVSAKIKKLQPPTTLVMVEMSQPRQTNVMKRGDYLNPGSEVEPGVPAILHGWKEGWPKNRLGLAKWLADRENPLVARVTVNRLWSQIMGRGLLKSEEDFGRQADALTHPELLDWLAVEFMDHDWSMKQLIKLIVMSKTYQQSSRVTPELLKVDPENVLYARGPRFRLSAETIRDNGLAISGLLSSARGGPPVMPFQPEGIWKTVGRNSPKWNSATDERRYRRGIYVVWRRAAPYPSFTTFDAPDRSACVVNRSRTNTPLQSLTLMNDRSYTEMAWALAQRIWRELPYSTDAEKLEHGTRLCVARQAQPAEVSVLMNLLKTQQEFYSENTPQAGKLVKQFQGLTPTVIENPAEAAAWFTVTNALLNLDETINK